MIVIDMDLEQSALRLRRFRVRSFLTILPAGICTAV